MAEKTNNVKATLSTGKIIYLRQPKIRDTEMAAEQVAKKADGDANLLQMFMQKALIQNILLGVDDKKLSPAEREDIDNLFSLSEYAEIIQVVGMMTGTDKTKKAPVLEFVSE